MKTYWLSRFRLPFYREGFSMPPRGDGRRFPAGQRVFQRWSTRKMIYPSPEEES